MPTFEPQSYYQNYVDGQFVDGGADRIVVDNPGTGAPLAEQASANAADIDAAVAAARRCHESGVLSAMRPVEPRRRPAKRWCSSFSRGCVGWKDRGSSSRPMTRRAAIGNGKSIMVTMGAVTIRSSTRLTATT